MIFYLAHFLGFGAMSDQLARNLPGAFIYFNSILQCTVLSELKSCVIARTRAKHLAAHLVRKMFLLNSRKICRAGVSKLLI